MEDYESYEEFLLTDTETVSPSVWVDDWHDDLWWDDEE